MPLVVEAAWRVVAVIYAVTVFWALIVLLDVVITVAFTVAELMAVTFAHSDDAAAVTWIQAHAPVCRPMATAAASATAAAASPCQYRSYHGIQSVVSVVLAAVIAGLWLPRAIPVVADFRTKLAAAIAMTLFARAQLYLPGLHDDRDRRGVHYRTYRALCVYPFEKGTPAKVKNAAVTTFSVGYPTRTDY